MLTAYGRGASHGTLGTLERCQQPVHVSPDDMLLALDEASAGGEEAVIWNVIRTRNTSRNTCNMTCNTVRNTVPCVTKRTDAVHNTVCNNARNRARNTVCVR